MSEELVNKFTTNLKNVLTRALCFVVEMNQSSITPTHLLWALGTQKGSIGAEILHKANVPTARLRELVAAAVPAEAEPAPGPLNPALSDSAKRVIEKAVLTASVYEHQYVGTEHLLSGLLQVNEPSIELFLRSNNIDATAIKQQIAIVLKSTSRFPDLTDAMPRLDATGGAYAGATEGLARKASGRRPTAEATAEGAVRERDVIRDQKRTPVLEHFARDLTSDDEQKRIDPVIGRETEIERVMEVLCRRTKNNPMLLGEPGVGKTAIVEGLATRIAEGSVPSALQNKRIMALDLALLIAGTMYRGEFEGRLKQIVEEVASNDDVILFIDEVHALVGAGAAGGSLDAANILKPALARGDIRCIGATTPAEFKKHIETDAALERRFQPVTVNEPSPEKALDILRGISRYYEDFHRVAFSDEALQAAVRFSVRYLQDKRLPDKAIDLMDEAAAACRIRKSGGQPQDRRAAVEAELRRLCDDKRQAVAEERYTEALDFKKRETELLDEWQGLKEREDETPRAAITGQDVAAVVARMTGVPMADLVDAERSRLARLEEALRDHVLGQDDALALVAGAVRRAKTGVSDPRRPLASFLFVGPSGVGKTELARALARTVFESEQALIRLDMSEFAEGFTVSKLVGSPAGYVGYRESAKLTDQVKQKPYSVVLFDELEKAHKDVQNLLLQILEEGELTDATGRRVNFKNTIIVMTSNIGTDRLTGRGIGFSAGEGADQIALTQDLRTELEERFRPELVNRIDHVCIFKPLALETLHGIAEKQLKELADRLAPQGTNLVFDEKATLTMAEAGAKSKLGARAIRRILAAEIEPLIAARLLKKPRPSALRLTHGKGGFVLRAERND